MWAQFFWTFFLSGILSDCLIKWEFVRLETRENHTPVRFEHLGEFHVCLGENKFPLDQAIRPDSWSRETSKGLLAL